ncbi:MAG: hypothetical protein ACKVPX_04125 [Myxococcaceae bacterium]
MASRSTSSQIFRPLRTRWLPTALDLALGALFAIPAILAWRHQFHVVVGDYDEGLILTNTFLMGKGQVPYRDFYTNYPPGLYLVLRALWWVGGETVNLERLLGAAVHAAVALGTGRLAARIAKHRFSLAAAGMCSLWLVTIAPVPFAYLCAVAMALFALELVARSVETASPLTSALAGMAVAGISFFRHDLFVYLVLAWAFLGVLGLVMGGTSGRRPRRSLMIPFVAGLALGLLAFWGPALLLGGVRQTFLDLYFDQIHRVHPARVLAMPKFWTWTAQGPQLWHEPLSAFALLPLLSPWVAALLCWRFSTRSSATVLALGLTLAVLPQMWGRTDLHHCLYTAAPSLAVLFGAARSFRSDRALVAVSALCAVLLVPTGQVRTLAKTPVRDVQTVDPRLKGISYDPVKQRVVLAVKRRTHPDEPVFFGLTDHRFTFVSEMDLYYLSERPGGLRRMQFDPNMSNQRDEQELMIADLEERGVNLAVLSARFAEKREADNASWNPGSTLLDDYLRERFWRAEAIGAYEVWVRTQPLAR